MAEATAGLAAGLKRLAAADLSFQLDQPFAPEFESLRSDYNAAVLQLRRDPVDRQAGDGTDLTAARRRSARAPMISPSEPSSRPRRFEETAAALDLITANVSNSSQRTQEARNVAIDARESAGQSASVVARAVEAMQRIEKSSNEINNIIVVIDEIALPDEPAGAECRRGGSARGRSRQGLRRRAQEVREPRPAVRSGRQGDQGPDPQLRRRGHQRRQAGQRDRGGAAQDRGAHRRHQPAYGSDRAFGARAVGRPERGSTPPSTRWIRSRSRMPPWSRKAMPPARPWPPKPRD
jgi:hypothetical protein